MLINIRIISNRNGGFLSLLGRKSERDVQLLENTLCRMTIHRGVQDIPLVDNKRLGKTIIPDFAVLKKGK